MGGICGVCIGCRGLNEIRLRSEGEHRKCGERWGVKMVWGEESQFSHLQLRPGRVIDLQSMRPPTIDVEATDSRV